MFMNKALRKHIVETDKQAKRRFEILMKQMLEKNPIYENLKNTDPLKWTGLMNNYKHSEKRVASLLDAKNLVQCFQSLAVPLVEFFSCNNRFAILPYAAREIFFSNKAKASFVTCICLKMYFKPYSILGISYILDIINACYGMTIRIWTTIRTLFHKEPTDCLPIKS